MAFVITEPCISTCDTACVSVCPVDCIPEECIDCGACEPECPVDAIYDEDDLQEEYEKYTEINANFFEE